MKTHRLRIGISSCLLGQEVRWDGAHKRDAWLSGILGRYVEWAAVCPEVDMGLPAPREPMNLVRRNGKIHLTADAGRTDLSRRLRAFAAGRLAALDDICGYVLKSRSPSCGAFGVRVRDDRGRVARNGRGLFAEALLRRFPCLPVEEESGLACPRRRENFIRRIFTYYRWRAMASSGASPQAIRRFHDRHRYLILAHGRAALARLERVAGAVEYFRLLFRALSRTPSLGNHAYALSRLAGQLECSEHRRVDGAIEAYRCGRAPLTSPLSLMRRYADRSRNAALRKQVYLYPHPDEWALLKQVSAAAPRGSFTGA
ncbi:MAG: YbgA family protein [Nitrospinales bacterium]